MNKKKLFMCFWFYFSWQLIRALEGISIYTTDGSFKLQDFKGEVTIHLTGSCLIYNLRGNISWEGKWKRMYAKEGRSIYKGKGNIKIKGEAKAIQFLGRSMDAKINGITKIILYPSLLQGTTKNLYKYDQEKKSHSWGAFSLDTLWLPKR